MKIKLTIQTSRQRGFATLIVLVLVFLMSALLMGNSRVLRHLQREIDLVEQKQLRKFEPALREKKTLPVNKREQ